jgi:ankyrin repeat protein
LHAAVLNKNLALIRKIFELDPSKCLLQNFDGKSPFHLAVETEDLETLTGVFADYKLEALGMKDSLGENFLFACARNGNEAIFRWFMGSNEYYCARGM